MEGERGRGYLEGHNGLALGSEGLDELLEGHAKLGRALLIINYYICWGKQELYNSAGALIH